MGRVRWTICAMLFFATSINYMDRQVIALLKPTLSHTIGLTEISYGYIVDAFQIAYAIGLLVAGRLVDKIGTRIGYMVIMGIWSLSAMGHALASTAFEFGIARFFLGLGESGNFPAAIKTVAEWFPQSERSLATGIFNSGANVGAILAPLIVPWVTIRFGWRAAFLVTGVFSAIWIAWWFTQLPQARRPSHADRRGAAPHLQGSRRRRWVRSVPWIKLLGYRQTWAFALGKFLTDPIWWFYLFWLPVVFQREVPSRSVAPRVAADHRLQRVGDRQHRWRLAALALPQAGLSRSRRARGGNALLRLPGRAGLHDRQHQFGVGGDRPAQPRRRGPPGLVGEPLHHRV